MKDITITYIGGGSRLWARSLFSDLALEPNLGGNVILYDIDQQAAEDNAKLATRMVGQTPNPNRWSFRSESSLEKALEGADFVFISILPGTFEDMAHYVHDPEKYGVYQSVGDTAGPSGLFRALIMMPMYERIALAIKEVCPNAWVINFTNPMTLCVQTLYHFFPEIKAFGNCHEVFHVQLILKRALKEATGIEANHREIAINPKGLNHFTWIDKASYKDLDLMPIYEDFARRYQKEGVHGDDWVHVGPFGSAERVKLDLFLKHHTIAAAGDRHLVEFLPQSMYLKDLETIKDWRFYLTPVALRMGQQKHGTESVRKLLSDNEPIKIYPSGEEGILQMKALLGMTELVTNVNMPNRGQIPNLPLGHVVETNALFRFDDLRPVYSGPLEGLAEEITLQHVKIHQLLIKAFDEKSLSFAYEALKIDPLTRHLSEKDRKAMFTEIAENIAPRLTHYTQKAIKD